MVASILLVIVSCSTKNNTSQSRWWHSFNAKYNTYYNGAQAYIDASLEKENGNKDNFTEIIPLYTVGNKSSKDLGKGNYERAIEKAEKAIARHSIKKKPEWNKSRRKTEKDIEWLNRKEYNPFIWKAWMLMGRSQFYKGAFEDAATTFSYMSRLYKTQPAIYGKARAWLAKSYIEAGWLYDAEDVIRNMKRDSLDWRAVREWNYTYADYYIHTGEFEKAIPYLQKVIKHEMRKKQKAREWYLMGQLQAALGNKEAAYNSFKHVIKANPPYELEFNARIAATEVMAAGQTKQMVSRLKRMAASDKNKDYLDQVYYAMGNIYLVAMYKLADVALVTPLRDGMNLVAKEYVATKDNDLGVLILSEMAGASSELSDAIQINPNDTDQISMAICEALEMPEEEQKERLQNMQDIVGKQTVKKWAGDFVDEWKEVIERNETLMKKYISKKVFSDIKQQYNASKHRLIMLDYDGTLAAFRRDPEKASPTTEVKNMLRKLCDDERNTVVINSGRDHRTLDKWLGDLPLSFAAEHGAFYKENGEWHENVEPQAWDERLMSILREFEDKTPNSRLEVKATAVAWHYRKVDNWIGIFRAQQLMHALIPICSQNNLQIMRGNKIVEVKPAEYSKGSEVQRILNQRSYDFILAIGDDVTDEDMFRALPEEAVTIKVGYACDDARYNLLGQKDVLPFLNNLLS